MGMSSQLLFTTIITLMKVAILMTYLRKATPLSHKSRSSLRHRNLPVETEQVVLLHHDLLHPVAKHRLLLRHTVPMLVSTLDDTCAQMLTTL
jgi:hypothetical protein